jgi:hypothetical protein
MFRIGVAILLSFTLLGCATSVDVKSRNILMDQYVVDKTYHVYVKYYNQDEIGITQSTDEIDTLIDVGISGNKNYYKWYNYKTRHSETSKDLRTKMELGNKVSDEWNIYPYGDGFEYLIDGYFVDEDTMSFKTPDLSSIPRDMEGFRFYTNIIDFHTWEVYKKLFFEGTKLTPSVLTRIGDKISMDMSEMSIPLMDWPNLTSDFTLDGGFLSAEYIGNKEENGRITPIVSFSQNQRLRQFVYGMAGPIQFKMPFKGTTRFMGFYYPDTQGTVLKGLFNEYVYAKVNAPMFIKVIVHSKREYLIEQK